MYNINTRFELDILFIMLQIKKRSYYEKNNLKKVSTFTNNYKIHAIIFAFLIKVKIFNIKFTLINIYNFGIHSSLIKFFAC